MNPAGTQTRRNSNPSKPHPPVFNLVLFLALIALVIALAGIHWILAGVIAGGVIVLWKLDR